MDVIAARAQREREHYNEGLKRDTYTKVFVSSDLDRRRRQAILREELQYANGRRILELGSHCWIRWIEELGISPRELECINISEREIEKGVAATSGSRVKPRFALMDANDLHYPDESFDMVFGNAILHHLEFEKAVNEVARVLKPGGRIVFGEPLGLNPVGKLIRFLTPQARTPDERPLRTKEIGQIEARFDARLYYEQFFSMPVAAVSRALGARTDNPVVRSAFKLDRFLEARLPALRMHYRHVLICGSKRGAATDG